MATVQLSNLSPVRVELGSGQRSRQGEEASSSRPEQTVRRQDARELQEQREAISELAEQLSDKVQVTQRALSFSVNEDIGRVILVVRDVATDEVIRQIPEEYIVTLAERLQALEEQGLDQTEGLDPVGLLLREQV